MPTSPPPNATATRRDRRRGEIVAAARRIVARRGLEALTFAALEESLDFTRGVVTYHFKGKDELVRAILDSAVGEIAAATASAVRAEASAPEKVRALLRAQCRGFLERPEAARVLLAFWGRLQSDEAARRRNASLYAAYRRQTARLLRDAMRSGELRSAPVEPLATLVVGIVLGVVVQHYFSPGAVDVDAAAEQGARALLARLTGPGA